ncbi:DUF6886 family protein [Rhizobium sp. RU36D]|uniref:DUF6886 family protein n=1 Tax=Rhizobium sp. RU36D TaxID=1907415 RepID=UPI0009D7C230|nr:DUF6886 family protein [Rhizobium sp. RU36D]SMD10779.1 hypothetical protein SAMN05880593_12215 [Rhizobium sp. RU36D]
MRLFHFSDDPDIESFVPRPVKVPSKRSPGMEWLNGPLVWAIEERLDFLYHFPRDCPRILIWVTDKTIRADRDAWLGGHRAAAYVELSRRSELEAATIHRYEFATGGFECLGDAGMWVSRAEVVPLERVQMTDLPSSFGPRGVDLRFVDSLVPLRPLWATSLAASGIRLRNARGWNHG